MHLDGYIVPDLASGSWYEMTFVFLTCPYYLSIFLLPGTVKLFQTHLLLFQSQLWNQPCFQEAIVPLSEEYYLETRIWVVTGSAYCYWSFVSLRLYIGNICMYVSIYLCVNTPTLLHLEFCIHVYILQTMSSHQHLHFCPLSHGSFSFSPPYLSLFSDSNKSSSHYF